MNRTTTMRAIGVIAALGLGLTTAACSSDSKSPGGGSSSGSSASGTALVVESNPVASFTEDFNPISTNSIGRLENTSSLIYEPLFQINSLDASQAPIPWLADKAEWSNGNKTVTITLHSGIKWSDGQDFTADDVKFTFDLIKSDPAANAFGAPTVSSTSVTNPTTVVLNFDTPQKANFVAIAQQLILPQHIWKSITKPEAAVVKAAQAIGTGPYLVDKFSSQLVTYKANPSYWQGEPKVKSVNLPAYADNNAASAALAKGDIDLTGNNIANVQTVFVGKDPQHNHLWTDKARTTRRSTRSPCC
ncbi:ABC transporter substrate-binding protein [Streptacidiphilus monticola]